MPDRDVTERAKCLLSGVTPGLWLYRDVIGGLHNVTVDMWDVAACSGGPIEDEEERRKYAAANAEFIAAAPQLVTDLLAEVVRLQALLNPVENWHGVVKGIN